MNIQQKPKIAIIATINSLNEISAKGDIDFCIASIAEKQKDYFDYFRKQKKKGRFVILDDLVAEGGDRMYAEDYVNLAIQLKVSEIIVPDYIGDYQGTRVARIDFLNRFSNLLKKHKIKIMSVIQGKNIYEYLLNYEELLEDTRIDTIGIPFRINFCQYNKLNKEENNAFNRFTFTHLALSQYKEKKPIHYLGCNLIREIKLMKHLPIRSFDSKILTRYGKSFKVFSSLDKHKPTIKLYIEDVLTQEQIKYALDNITKFKQLEDEIWNQKKRKK